MAALAAGALLAMACPAAQAQTSPARTIGIGDPSRAQLLDALRAVIAKDLGQPVKFVVDDMRVQGEWAFIVAHPQTPAGAPIDFSKTHYAERQAEGVLDGDTLYALLRRVGGKWTVVDFMIGPTDVGWMDWQDSYHTPAGLIPQPGSAQ
jgi:hypothetical protein